MKTSRTCLMFLFIFIGCVVMVNSTYAQAPTPDLTIWEGKWFKVNVVNDGWHQYTNAPQKKYSHHSNGLYLNIGTVNYGEGTFPFTMYVYDITVSKWIAMSMTVHYMAADSLNILGYVQQELIGTVGADQIGMTIHIVGKVNRQGKLVSATFKTLGGYINGNGCQVDCADYDLTKINFGKLTIDGSFIDASKVPVPE
jgi:hypothetical protein